MSDPAIVKGGDGELAGIDPRALTPARIGLARTGVSLASRHVLELAEAHALARDAVHAVLPVASLLDGLRERGLPAIAVKSAARTRAEYLRRPDLGRRLDAGSLEALKGRGEGQGGTGKAGTRVTVVLEDGLSALAVERHALAVLDALLPAFGSREKGERSEEEDWALTPVVVAEQARVALGDAVAEALGSEVVVVLIGERPGLSSPDSLGAYITWRPHVGSMDAERNCVSNIRAEGLGYGEAAERIAWYCTEGRRAGRTGVALLDARNTALPGASKPVLPSG